MAVTYGFYDSLNHDRLYNAQQMSAIFDGIINDGVFMSVGNQFHTVAGTGMQVIVKSGRAWFDSTWTLNDAEYPLSIDAADVLLTRIDAVVLEVNSEVATRANTIKVVKGTPASTPAKPTLTNTATIHQHALAYVTVAKNITAITNSMIEIVVGKTETPYVTAILQTTDITDLYNQWEDYFQTWFDTVRGTLDGDVALNLQNQITTLRRDTLKNTTPPIIGLPASATPDDMFQALGNTGDLHVWQKTVTTAQEIPAGYTLENATNQELGVKGDGGTAAYCLYIYYCSTISVDDNGTVHPGTETSIEFISSANMDRLNACKGKFIRMGSGKYSSYTEGEFFIPSDAVFNFTNNVLTVNKCQKVNSYPKTPAGTTTTYPVSTNPNAYQEGSNAKPAGYTLGEVVTGDFILGHANAEIGYSFYKASSPTVSDDGTIEVDKSHSILIFHTENWTASTLQAAIRGQFLQRENYMDVPSSFVPAGTIYIPNDAVVTQSNYTYTVSKYQPITGYAAIPAGTTIEYLGKLGDKARVQVVSYVGTGTYGSSNPNSLTFDFVPKMLFVVGPYTSDWPYFMFATEKVSYAHYSSRSHRLTFTLWNKTVKWYYDNADGQLNLSGRNYDAVAIG